MDENERETEEITLIGWVERQWGASFPSLDHLPGDRPPSSKYVTSYFRLYPGNQIGRPIGRDGSGGRKEILRQGDTRNKMVPCNQRAGANPFMHVWDVRVVVPFHLRHWWTGHLIGTNLITILALGICFIPHSSCVPAISSWMNWLFSLL